MAIVAEEWRPWRDGTYEVSSLGNVRRAKPGISTFIGRPVKPLESPTGYDQVALKSEGRVIRTYVHRAVLEAFVGPCPPLHVVNHKDAKKRNNKLSNLEYVTCKENVAHALANVKRHKGPKKPKKEKVGVPSGDNHWSRLRPERIARGEQMRHKVNACDVRSIRARVEHGQKQTEVAKEFGLSVAQISRIVRRTRWAHV